MKRDRDICNTKLLQLVVNKKHVYFKARYRSDKDINNRSTHVLNPQTGAEFSDVSWHKVKVGDIIKLYNNESVPV